MSSREWKEAYKPTDPVILSPIIEHNLSVTTSIRSNEKQCREANANLLRAFAQNGSMVDAAAYHRAERTVQHLMQG